jgi:hypothetical protein
MKNKKPFISKVIKIKKTDFAQIQTEKGMQRRIALKKGRNKFRGHILDKSVHYYRMWFHLVRLVIDCEQNKIKFGSTYQGAKQHTVKLNKRFYKDWDIYNYLDATFDEWFDDKIHLFAEKEQVSLEHEGEKSEGYMYIKFHVSQRKEDIVNQVRTKLKNERYRVSAKYQIKKKHRYFNIHQQYNAFILKYLLEKDFDTIRFGLDDWYSRFSSDFESTSDTETYYPSGKIKKGAWNSPQSMNKVYRRAELLVLNVAQGEF